MIIYIFFRKLSDIKESFAFSLGLIYILIIVTRAFVKAGFPWGLNKTSVRRRNFTSTTRILPSVFPRGLIEAINFQTSLGMRNYLIVKMVAVYNALHDLSTSQNDRAS